MTLYEVAFAVDILQGKQRPRFNGLTKQTYTPEKTKAAENAIATAYKGASIRKYGRVVSAPRGVPVAIRVDCYAPPPKRRPKWVPTWLYELLAPLVPFTKKPDWDNLGKTVSDGLNAVAYNDDSQITAAHIYKHDMAPGDHKRTEAIVQFYLPDRSEE